MLTMNEEITYWKKAAFAKVLNESEEKELVDLAPSRVLLIRKEKSEKAVNIDEIIFYLKSIYSTYNEGPRTFIHDIPTEEPSFEAITNYLKHFQNLSQKMKIMSLKNKCLFGGWILMSKVYRKENLSYRFEDWLYHLCKIKRQARQSF